MIRPKRRLTATKYQECLLPVLVYIEEHLDEPLPLERLATMAGFSPYHFHRVFQHLLGESPKEYLRRLRLERAVYRLKISPDNVLAIALAAGYKTHETFTRAFVRHFEVHPAQFRAILKEYRTCAEEAMLEHGLEGFTPETPLSLRFNMRKESVGIEQTPSQHMLFVRYYGYENLLASAQAFLELWSPLFEFADRRGLAYSKERLIGITHDDPYVTSEANFRFDACLPVAALVDTSYPVGSRTMQAGLCLVRRHVGGMEEIAKTFACIGVEWLLASQAGVSSAPPFEVYTCQQDSGQWKLAYTDAYVPLELATQLGA